MLLKQMVISGLAWSAGGRFLAQIITWGITIIVIRLLTPTDYGLMSLAMVFVAFLGMLSELGMGAALVQRRDLDENSLRSLFGMVLLTSILFYSLLAFSAPIISNFYDEPRLTLLIRVLSLSFLFLGFSIIPQSLLERNLKFRMIATVDFISAIAGSFITLALALMGHGVWSLVWGTLMIRLVSLIGFNMAQPFLRLPSARMQGMWIFFSFGSYVTLSRIFWYFYSRADVLIVGKILGKELLGFYSVGLMLATLPMEKISGILNRVAFPAYSSVQSERGMVGRHFLKAVRMMSFFAFPVLWGISSISPEIIRLLLGNEWDNAVLPMQIIALIIPFRMIGNLMSPAVLGAGRPDVEMATNLLPLILMPPAFFIGSFWGLMGVSLVWPAVFPLVFCLNLSRVAKALEVHFFEVLQAIQMPFLAGVTMYAGVYLVKMTPAMNIQLLPQVLVLMCSGALVYFFMTLLLNRRGLNEVRDLVRL